MRDPAIETGSETAATKALARRKKGRHSIVVSKTKGIRDKYVKFQIGERGRPS